MRFDPFSPDPTIRALARREQIERDKARGITSTGRHVLPLVPRCSRCKGARIVFTTHDGWTTRVIPCPRCQRPQPPTRGASADRWQCLKVAA